MPSYAIHVAIMHEYIRKNHINNNHEEYISGTVSPDQTNDKSKTHYGKTPAHSNVAKFLENNEIETPYDIGKFIHIVTDYLFYNKYLETPLNYKKEIMYDDYNILNERIVKKYKFKISHQIKDVMGFKKGELQYLNEEKIYNMINDISDLDIEKIKIEAKAEKWNTYIY